MDGRCFEVEGNYWKKQIPLSSFGSIWVEWDAFMCSTADLLKSGWSVEVVENRYTKKQRLYIRNPRLRMVGCGSIECMNSSEFPDADPWYASTLDFMVNQKVLRAHNPKIKINDVLVELDLIDIDALLGMVLIKQQAEKKLRAPKPKPPVLKKSSAEIIDIAYLITAQRHAS